MRKFTVILFILVLVVLLLPLVSVTAQPSHIPHENPSTAGGSANPILLLLFQGDVFDLVLGGQYHDAQGLLDELRHANIPGDLQYIVDRFRILSNDLIADLDNLEGLLDEITVSLELYQIDEARQMLEDARIILWDAEELRDEIEAAATAIGRRLYIDRYATTSQLRQAYERLQEMLARLRELYSDFESLLDSLFVEYDERAMIELLPTYLTLETALASVFVGDSIVVYGQLSSENGSLAHRDVSLYFVDRPEVITTDEDGSYRTTIGIPYEYVTEAVLGAEYSPAGDDIGVYMASESPELTVDISYYRTYLELSVPEVAYPGLPITVTGVVSSTGDFTERTVSLLMDNTHLATIQVEDDFAYEMVIPDGTSIGDHTLTVAVVDQGRYAGTSRSLNIRVSQFQLQADIQAPSIIVLPGEVHISGQVRSDYGPLSDASVRLSFGESSSVATVTSADGSFEAVLEEPMRLSLVGPKRLTAEIEPVEPYYSSTDVDKWIIVVNPVGISLTLVGLVSVGFVVYRRVTTRVVRADAGTPALRAGLPVPAPVAPSSELESHLPGIRGEVLTAYLEGRGAVERSTGIRMESRTTLREYLRLIRTSITEAVEQPFAELTAMTEVVLYSARELDASMATGARQYVADIKEVIDRDAT
jgi:hypothetical protein